MLLSSRWMLGALASTVLCAATAHAEPTESLLKAMADLKLDRSVLSGLDEELAVPTAWIEGAKKERTVRLRLNISPQSFAPIGKAFTERYPGVSVDYTFAVGRARAMEPLLAFKNGKYVTDIVYGFDAIYPQFKEANALLDLSDLPALKGIPEKFRDPDNLYVGYQVTFWCLAYNTNLVKPADLPKTWEDFIMGPRFRNGKVGMGNKPFLWLPHLWGVKGDAWIDKYMPAVFDVLKPQFRKESQSGLMAMLNLGEFQIAIPSYPDGVMEQVKKGAKIGFHCPEPVPSAYNPFGIFRGSPSTNAARLFVNWYISKEGQIIAAHAAGLPPAHKDLQRSELIPYYDTIKGKQEAPYTQRVMDKIPEINERWNKLWLSAGGK